VKFRASSQSRRGVLGSHLGPAWVRGSRLARIKSPGSHLTMREMENVIDRFPHPGVLR
jgi:hypothetical protein